MFMKKILSILVLSLLLGGSSFAGVEEVLKEIKKNKDIVQGFKKKLKNLIHGTSGVLTIKQYLNQINQKESM